MISFDDCGGSMNSPLGAERLRMVGCSIEKDKKEKKGKTKDTLVN
jgi:hypothetical protein